MEYSKVCLYCGKEFIAKRRTAIFCGNSCSKKAYHAGTYIPKPDEEKAKICPICGKEFIPSIGGNRQTYCSAKCRRERENRRANAKYVPKIRPLAEPRNCLYCGKKFSPDIIHADQKTCSQECYHKYQGILGIEERKLKRENILSQGRECIVCGKHFIPTSYGNTICSDGCKNILKTQRRKEKYESMTPEEKTQLYKHKKNKRFRSSYEKVLARDNGICQICGSSEKTQIHHINGKGECRKDKAGHREHIGCDHSLNNLITLCIQCHKDMHNNLLVKHKGKWYIKGSMFKKLGLTGSVEIWDKD